MPTEEPQGFNIDIGDLLREATKKRTTRRRTTSSSSNDMDAAIRRAIRVELADVERVLREIAAEVVRLRKANEKLADQVAKLTRR